MDCFVVPPRNDVLDAILSPHDDVSGAYFLGPDQGAWAEAKNRSGVGPKAELSGLRLRAGRGAIAERLPSARRHSPP